jgi:hypothetical protein
VKKPPVLIPVLSDVMWKEVEQAAAPYVGGAEARLAVESCFHEYLNLRIRPEKVLAERDRWQHLVDVGEQFASGLHVRLTEAPWSEYDPEQPRRDFEAVKKALLNALTILEGLKLLARARQGRRNPERELLLGRLTKVWTTHFGGPLTVTNPTTGVGPPSGPLVRFLVTTTKHVLPEPLNPHIVGDFLDRSLGQPHRRRHRRRPRSRKR